MAELSEENSNCGPSFLRPTQFSKSWKLTWPQGQRCNAPVVTQPLLLSEEENNSRPWLQEPGMMRASGLTDQADVWCSQLCHYAIAITLGYTVGGCGPPSKPGVDPLDLRLLGAGHLNLKTAMGSLQAEIVPPQRWSQSATHEQPENSHWSQSPELAARSEGQVVLNSRQVPRSSFLHQKCLELRWASIDLHPFLTWYVARILVLFGPPSGGQEIRAFFSCMTCLKLTKLKFPQGGRMGKNKVWLIMLLKISPIRWGKTTPKRMRDPMKRRLQWGQSLHEEPQQQHQQP